MSAAHPAGSVGARLRGGAFLLTLSAGVGCAPYTDDAPVLTISGSAVGAEAAVLDRQLERFALENPDVRVRVQTTPDDATQRHQLYVQWLNARTGSPDVLQLDVVWTPEFAAAGWILPLAAFRPERADFFPATLEANTWRGELYAIPWFVDVGMLYFRSDLIAEPPATLEELLALARQAGAAPGIRDGIVWQGARYEGLVTTFLEYLGGFGGRILDERGRVVVDSPAGVAALTFMRDQIHLHGVAPAEVLTWREEETRFAFQNGSAAFMRNWPYAFPLLEDSAQSAVAGRFAVAPMPGGPGGTPTAALGGAQLAINAHSAHAEPAHRLIAYLTAPAQMLERAALTGQLPARISLYDDPRLTRALPLSPADARAIVEHAVPRPVNPVYTELSGLLQVELHRALAGQSTPETALARAAAAIDQLLRRTGVADLLAETAGG